MAVIWIDWKIRFVIGGTDLFAIWRRGCHGIVVILFWMLRCRRIDLIEMEELLVRRRVVEM